MKLLSLLCLYLGFGCSAPLRSTIVIPKHELQAKVASRFPIEKRVFVARLALENPQVALDENGDQLMLDVDGLVSVGSKSYRGTMGVIGGLEYDDEEDAIYMKDAVISRIAFPDLPEDREPMVRELATSVLRSALREHPVYRLEKTPQKMLVRAIAVKEGAVQVEVGL